MQEIRYIGAERRWSQYGLSGRRWVEPQGTFTVSDDRSRDGWSDADAYLSQRDLFVPADGTQWRPPAKDNDTAQAPTALPPAPPVEHTEEDN